MSHLTEEQLNEYVDHLLTSTEAEEVEHHLIECAICQKKVAELQQVFAALADLPEVPFQMDLATRVQHLLEPLPQIVPERHLPRSLPGWVPRLTWIIAALEIPLAGLTLAYASPMLRVWLAPMKVYFSQPLQELILSTWLPVWWNGLNANGLIQSILTWSSQIQQAVDYLYTQPRIPNWSTPEGILILAVLLTAWAAGNYLLFNMNRKKTS
jgi:hypothetical protein